jgi:S1-C subfamily serine protease
MKRYVYRGSEYLGTHSLDEATAMLEAGTLMSDDWVAEGLSYIPLVSWLEEAVVNGPHALPERKTLPPQFLNWQATPPPTDAPQKMSGFHLPPAHPQRKVISLRQVESPDSRPWISRRSLLLGAVTCLTGAALAKFVGQAASSEFNGVKLPFSIDNLRRSIVRILIKTSPASSGTGFCIACESLNPNGSVIATASHVVGGDRLDSLLDDPRAAIIETSDGRTAALEHPYCWDKGLDHCAVNSGLTISALKLATKLPAIGERIYALGFAEGETFTIVEGTVTSYAAENFRLVTSAKISSGFSGGPVVNSAGEVVGMSVARRTKGPPSSSSVPLHELQNLVQRMDFIMQSGKQ